MRIRRYDVNEAEERYGSLHLPVFAGGPVPDGPPFQSAIGILKPGERTAKHSHLDREIFVILKGRALVFIDGREIALSEFDAIELDPLTPHSVCGADETVGVTYLRLSWLNQGDAARPAAKSEQGGAVIVTATPPTPNGDLHLGHLSGPYLRADIFVRALRLQGRQAVYVTGIDDHQSYVATKAEELGQAPGETADKFGEMIKRSWEAADIGPSIIWHPRRSSDYAAKVRETTLELVRRGYVEQREAPAVACSKCERYLFEAHVHGICPHCGASANGNACEVCCRPNDCHDLIDPRCTKCGGKAERVEYKRLFFRLPLLAAGLRDTVHSARLSTPLAALARTMLAEGLPDISISHRCSWGFPVPLEGFDDQRLYVWYEMAIGYAAVLRDLRAGRYVKEFPRDRFNQAEVIQFFGMDNGWFHALLFPAVSLALGDVDGLPRTMLTNEFLYLDGEKFSTSRNHAIWAGAFLEKEPTDLVRYYLAFVGPDTSQRNFTLDAYRAETEAEIRGLWRHWLSLLDTDIVRRHDGVAPEPGLWLDDQRAFLAELDTLHRSALAAFELDRFSPERALRAAGAIVRLAMRAASAERSLDASEALAAQRRTATALQLAAARSLAIVVNPVMPRFATGLLGALGIEADAKGFDARVPQFVSVGVRPKPLAAIVP